MAAAAAWTHTCEEFIRRSLLEGVPRLCSTTSFSLHLCWQTQEEPMMMVSARSKRLSKRDDQEAKRTLFQLEGRVNARNWLSEPMRWEEERAAERQTDGLWGARLPAPNSSNWHLDFIWVLILIHLWRTLEPFLLCCEWYILFPTGHISALLFFLTSATWNLV